MLRMEKNYTREERLARVDQVLYDVREKKNKTHGTLFLVSYTVVVVVVVV